MSQLAIALSVMILLATASESRSCSKQVAPQELSLSFGDGPSSGLTQHAL